MADQSSGFSDQLVSGDSVGESGIYQPNINGGMLRLGGYENQAFEETSTDPEPGVLNGHAPNAENGTAPNAGNGTTSAIRLPPPPSKKDILAQKNTSAQTPAESTPTADQTDVSSSGYSLPVVYDNRSGNNVVIQERVVVPQSDGTSEIQTRAIPERWRELDRPLRQKQLKFLKVFGTIAIIFFFPTGIPACYYAFKAKTEFDEGIMRGNIDTAAKYAKRAERLIILSGILALIFGILIFAMIERSMNPERYASWHPGGIVGQ
ncbi:uncharacterized protein LOC124288592 [Haliotis rubra]|uniref:uncharacterized protein LOC124288592 n=1 Tax=Haliotis rubra TaxID=36100 RepID=UPI001EE619A0|nr:uncharacterized protein LOC124288592 [Haliotis rubra]XP_046581099.1 uncharacterized protein LOC124288592 [Haliotis rubra]